MKRMLLLAMALVVLACSTPGPQVPARTDGPTVDTAPVRMVQLGHGTTAAFAACQGAGCPRRTPKTAANAPTALSAPSAPSAASSGDARWAALARDGVPHAAGAPPSPTADALRLAIEFPFNSSALTPKARDALRAASARLAAAEEVRVEGRTDGSGPTEVNERLAQARANAVRDAILATAPQLADRLQVSAKGACCFVASNSEAAGRARNRRVDITALPAEEVLP